MPFLAFAQFTDSQKSNLNIVNEWSNGGGETGKVNWSESGAGTLSTDTSTKLRGKASIKFVSAGANDYVASAGVSCKQGPNCLVRFYYKTTGTSWTAYIYDGSSNLIQALVLPANTEFSKAELSFVAATPTTLYSLRVVDGSAGSDTVYIDSGSLSANDNIGSVAQAEFYGLAKWPSASGCSWGTTSSSFASFSADSDCTIPAGSNLEGKATAPATKIPAITFSYMPAGRYYVVAIGAFSSFSSVADARSSFRFSDGTNNSISNTYYMPTVQIGTWSQVVGEFTYLTAKSNVTIEIQAQSTGTATNTTLIDNSNSPSGVGDGMSISVYYFPSAAEQVVRAEVANQFGYVEWLNKCLAETATGSFATLTNASCDLGSSTFGNAVATNDLIEITSTNLGANKVYKISLNGSLEAYQSTTATSCDFRIFDGTNVIATQRIAQANSSVSAQFASSMVGYVSYPSIQASKTFSVQAVRNSGDGSCALFASASFTKATLSIEEVYPTQAMPQIINSVGTSYNGQTIFNSSRIGQASDASTCTSSPCTTYGETGDWISSVTRVGTGSYTVNLNSGVYTSPPNCSCTPRGITTVATCFINSQTISAVGVLTYNTLTQAPGDESFVIHCHGIK